MEVSQTHSHVDAEEVSSSRAHVDVYNIVYVADGHTFDTGTQHSTTQRTLSDCFPILLTHSCCAARE